MIESIVNLLGAWGAGAPHVTGPDGDRISFFVGTAEYGVTTDMRGRVTLHGERGAAGCGTMAEGPVKIVTNIWARMADV